MWKKKTQTALQGVQTGKEDAELESNTAPLPRKLLGGQSWISQDSIPVPAAAMPPGLIRTPVPPPLVGAAPAVPRRLPSLPNPPATVSPSSRKRLAEKRSAPSGFRPSELFASQSSSSSSSSSSGSSSSLVPPPMLSGAAPPSTTATQVRKSNSQKCLSPDRKSGRGSRERPFSTVAHRGNGSIFRSNSDLLRAAVNYLNGQTIDRSICSPNKLDTYFGGAGSVGVLEDTLESFRSEGKSDEADLENLVTLYLVGPFDVQVSILRTLMIVCGLQNTFAHIGHRLCASNDIQTRRQLVNLLSSLVFQAQESPIFRKEAPQALVGQLGQLIGVLRDSDRLLQTSISSMFTCADVDLFDALLSLTLAKMHGSVAAPLDLLIKCLGGSDTSCQEIALVGIFYSGANFRRIAKDTDDEETLLVEIAKLIRSSTDTDIRVLSAQTLLELIPYTPCFTSAVLEILVEACKKDKSEKARSLCGLILKSIGAAEEIEAVGRGVVPPSPSPKAIGNRTHKEKELYVVEAVAAMGGDRCSVATISRYLQQHHQMTIPFPTIKILLRSLEEKKVISKALATYRIRK